jgi:chaperonin GroES
LAGLSLLVRDGRTYFCRWAGLSAGFAGLSWVCYCGVAGVGFAGLCGSDVETMTFVMVIFFHEKKHSNFHYSPQLCIASVQTRSGCRNRRTPRKRTSGQNWRLTIKINVVVRVQCFSTNYRRTIDGELAVSLEQCQKAHQLKDIGLSWCDPHRAPLYLPTIHRTWEERMKFRPLHDRVVVERIDAEAMTAGGIIIPDTAKERPSQGKIVSVGPGGRDDQGTLVPIDLEVGDRVLFGKWSGTEVKIEGIEYLIMKESDIMGVLDGAVEAPARKKAA